MATVMCVTMSHVMVVICVVGMIGAVACVAAVIVDTFRR